MWLFWSELKGDQRYVEEKFLPRCYNLKRLLKKEFYLQKRTVATRFTSNGEQRQSMLLAPRYLLVPSTFLARVDCHVMRLESMRSRQFHLLVALCAKAAQIESVMMYIKPKWCTLEFEPMYANIENVVPERNFDLHNCDTRAPYISNRASGDPSQ